MKTGNTKPQRVAWLWAIVASLGPSAFLYYLGVPYSVFYMVAFAALLSLSSSERLSGELSYIGFVVFFFCMLSICGALYWGGEVMFAVPSLLCGLMLVSVSALRGEYIELIAKVYVRVVLLILVGAWVGFLLALLGVGPIVVFSNPDGREVGVYLTSLSNTAYDLGNSIVIRPSGIYDEPGALSFFSVSAAFVNEIVLRNRRNSWLILALGVITGSLAHMLFMVVFAIHAVRPMWRIVLIGAFSVGMVWVFNAANNVDAQEDASGYILKLTLLRLATTEDGGLSGDNRSDLIANATARLQQSNLLFGLDHSCVTSVFECKERYGNFGENPLSPIVSGGLFGIGGLYAGGMVFIIYMAFRYGYIVLMVGMGLMFLQRPYLFVSPQYTLPFVIGCAYLMRCSMGAEAIRESSRL